MDNCELILDSREQPTAAAATLREVEVEEVSDDDEGGGIDEEDAQDSGGGRAEDAPPSDTLDDSSHPASPSEEFFLPDAEEPSAVFAGFSSGAGDCSATAGAAGSDAHPLYSGGFAHLAPGTQDSVVATDEYVLPAGEPVDMESLMPAESSPGRRCGLALPPLLSCAHRGGACRPSPGPPSRPIDVSSSPEGGSCQSSPEGGALSLYSEFGGSPLDIGAPALGVADAAAAAAAASPACALKLADPCEAMLEVVMGW